MPIPNTLFQSYRWQNALQSALLLLAMLILTGLLGWILWGVNGIMLLEGMAAILFLLILMGQLSISWFAILLLIFSPNLSALAQLGLSRTREYEADRGAVELTGDPRGLASALFKLEQFQGSSWEQILLPCRKVPDPSLLRTHPPTQKRIERLLAFDGVWY